MQTRPYVLAGADGTAGDERVLAWAMRAAGRRGADCVVAHGWHAARRGAATGECHARAQELLRAAVVRARAMDPGVPVRGESAVGHPGDLLVHLGRGAELTVIGPGERRLHSLGAIAERVVTHAPGPVVIVRGRGRTPLRGIGVGVDGSPAAREALAFAVEEARLNGARLVVASSYWTPDPPYNAAYLDVQAVAGRRGVAEQMVEEAVGPYARKYPELQVSVMVAAEPPGPLLGGLAEDMDLIVVGDRGRGPVARFVLGSISHGLAHHAACPVTVVPASPEEASS